MIMNSTNYQTELKSYLARVQHFTLALAVNLFTLEHYTCTFTQLVENGATT